MRIGFAHHVSFHEHWIQWFRSATQTAFSSPRLRSAASSVTQFCRLLVTPTFPWHVHSISRLPDTTDDVVCRCGYVSDQVWHDHAEETMNDRRVFVCMLGTGHGLVVFAFSRLAAGLSSAVGVTLIRPCEYDTAGSSDVPKGGTYLWLEVGNIHGLISVPLFLRLRLPEVKFSEDKRPPSCQVSAVTCGKVLERSKG